MTIEWSINGTSWASIPTFGNVSYSQGIDGCGVSGVSTSSLSFTTPNEYFSSVTPAAYIRCSAIPNCVFHVNQRDKTRHLTSVSCVDKAALMDIPIDLTDARGSDSAGNIYMTSADIKRALTANCKGLDADVLWTPTQYGFPVADLEGVTYRELLNMISENCGGFYAINYVNNTLSFVSAAGAVPLSGTQIAQHSYVNHKGSFTYKYVILEGLLDYQHGKGTGEDFQPLGYTVYPYTPAVDDYATLTVSNAFTSKASTAYFSWVNTKEFKEWECSNAVLSVVPHIGDYVCFAQHNYQTMFRVTQLNARWVGNTILASLSGGVPSNGETGRRSLRQLEIDNKLGLGTAYGPTLVTRYQGIIFLEA